MEVALPSLFNWTGECPYWDTRTQELSLVDACTSTDECTSFNIPASEPQFSVVSHKNEVIKVNWTEDAPMNQGLMFNVDTDKPGNRLNDGKCDRAGVLIAGTMSDEISPGVLRNPKSGSLYRYRGEDKEATMLVSGFDLSNGIDWTTDYTKMLFADSVMRKIFIFDYDTDSSSASNQSVCIDFTKYPLESLGLPDGLSMDARGRLWVACFWVGKVVQFDVETGEILQQVILPTACTTSCCFGGPNLTDMYVTSSKFGVGNDASKGIEDAGSLFKIPGSIHQSRGLEMNPFQL